MSNRNWARDDVQFPRLLAEINAVGLSPKQRKALRASMDISKKELRELFARAEDAWSALTGDDCAHERQDVNDRDLIYCLDCNEELGR